MFIFLDDYRVPSDVTWYSLPKVDWTIIRSFEEFKFLLDSLTEAPTYIAFDHDLADAHYKGDFSNPDEKTGMDCAKYYIEKCLEKGWKVSSFGVHSLNPDGKKNIETYLFNARIHHRL